MEKQPDFGGDPVISENVGTLGPLKMMDTLISGPIHTNSGDLASPDTGSFCNDKVHNSGVGYVAQ